MVVDISVGYIEVATDGLVVEYTRGGRRIPKNNFEFRWVLGVNGFQELINNKSREILNIFNFSDRLQQKPICLNIN